MIVPTRLTMNAFRHVSTAALHSLKRYNDAIAAYEEGLAKFPNDEALKKGIEEVKRDKDGPPRGMGGMGGMGLEV